MSLISIITPTYNPVPEHLLAAYESVRSQTMPSGWDWEWLVQEDGQTRKAEDILPADARIVFGRARHGGSAITRNFALSHARGDLVKNLDGDDILTPGALGRDITNMQRNVRWTCSRVLDLMPDGTTIGFDNDPEPGRIEPGYVFDHWKSHNYRLPIHPTTICIDRQLVIALGGWMAVPGSDDTGMFVAASLLSPGYFESEVGLLYRKWPGQGTASAEHTEAYEWRTRMHLIEERGEAIRAGEIAAAR